MRSLALLSALQAGMHISLAVAAVLGVGDFPSLNQSTTVFDVIPEDELALMRRATGATARGTLRIMPLGASIVEGVGSDPEHNGFRGYLRQALRFDGFQVDMVGSKHDGTIEDNDDEGHPGHHISTTLDNFGNSKQFKPNVVVLNVGTNDANGYDNIPTAKERMRALLLGIWGATDMADTCIMLSTLLPTTYVSKTGRPGEPNVLILNQYYRELVKELEGSHCIYLAEMNPLEGIRKGWIDIGRDGIGDGIHPNKVGHSKMAYVFWQAILQAYNDGKIEAPFRIDENATSTEQGCNKAYNSGTYAGVTSLGYGFDDGIYHHDSTYEGILWNHTSKFDQDQFFFAALVEGKYDYLLGWYADEKAPFQNSFAVWKNTGANFERVDDLNPGLHCLPRGIHFLDMNSDGLDDLVCIDAEGNAYLSINQGDGTPSKLPTFRQVTGPNGETKIKTTEGFRQERIRMADIDGDGRGDYLAIDNGGNIRAWRNGWVNDFPKFWEPLGTRFGAKGKGNITGVNMLDLNGDGRADWLWISDIGEVETWTSSRTCQTGKPGDGLKVHWRQGFAKGQSSGYTHAGVAEFNPKGDIRTRIKFGRIWGDPQDFGLNGRKDYAYFEHSVYKDKVHTFKMRAWRNKGSGGTKVKADGVKFCNMLNHEDGREDYVWTFSDGRMVMFENVGKGRVKTGEAFWGKKSVIFDPETLIGKKLDRRDLHLMDWDGDGDCDIVWTDPDHDNRPSVWLNLHHTTGSWSNPKTWDYYPNAQSSASGVSCQWKRGIDLHDKAVRFADIDGNGRDDYLCIRPDGHIDGYIHTDDNKWKYVGQIKLAQDRDRANLRFADVTGDGKDDMLWVNKYNGDGYIWYNRGRGGAGDGGSYIHWEHHTKPVYNSDRAGTCVYFPDLDGNKRADINVVRDVYSNKASSWFTPDCAVVNHHGDGGAGPEDPHLPVPPGETPIQPGDAPGSGPGDGGPGGNGEVVYIPPDFWPPKYGGSGAGDNTLSCDGSCTYVYPPLTLPSPTTIDFPPYTTAVEVGCYVSTTKTNNGQTSTGKVYVSIVVTTTVNIPATVVSILPLSNEVIVPGIISTELYPVISFEADPVVISNDKDPLKKAGFSCIATSSHESRTVTPVPWPWFTFATSTTTTTDPFVPVITVTHTSKPPTQTCSGSHCGELCSVNCLWPCETCTDEPKDCTDTVSDEQLASCTTGGDCDGPTCTKGGNCQGPKCVRGGDCKGPNCDRSGSCKGPKCHRGGVCRGPKCHSGGGCSGLGCINPGKCLNPFDPCIDPPCLLGSCPPNGGLDTGGGDYGYPDPDRPDNPNDPDDPDECTTSTRYSTCTEECFADYQTGGCDAQGEVCTTYTGCETDSTSTVTVTPAPYGLADHWDVWETGTIEFDDQVSAAAGIISYLSSIGDYDLPSFTVTSTLGNGEIIGCTDGKCTSTTILGPPFPVTTTKGNGEVDGCNNKDCSSSTVLVKPFPVTSTLDNGAVIGCSDNKCTSTTQISQPTPVPCVEFHCNTDDQRHDLGGIQVDAQVYEDGERVCNVFFFISHDGDGLGETKVWGQGGPTDETGGCNSDDYELSILSDCNSYTFQHFSRHFETSFTNIRTDEYDYSCPSCTTPFCDPLCSSLEVCAKGGDDTCLSQQCELCGHKTDCYDPKG